MSRRLDWQRAAERDRLRRRVDPATQAQERAVNRAWEDWLRARAAAGLPKIDLPPAEPRRERKPRRRKKRGRKQGPRGRRR
jgi:hypothetical protein